MDKSVSVLRCDSVRLCVVFILITSSVALMQFAPAHMSSASADLELEPHLACSAIKPPAEMFERIANANANANQEGEKRRRKRQAVAPQPIRITTVYDTSFSSLQNATYMQQIVEQAVTSLRQALLVRRPATAPISKARTCTTCTGNCPYNCSATERCYVIKVAQQYLQTCNVCASNGTVTGTVGGPGVNNTDYLLFVSSVSTRCSSSTVAYATVCDLDPVTWRPNVGMLNICPVAYTQGTLLYSYETTMHIIAHEFTHTLGFNSLMYPYFIDDNGSPLSPFNLSTGLPYTDSLGKYIWSDRVAVTKSVMWQTASGFVPVNKTYIVTPTVVNFVRQFFNCSSLLGAELEDQGGSGSALSHWEKRIFVTEYMSPIASEQMYISGLTLALLQDSGWYYANFSAAEEYSWGQGLGCMFANESCLTWINAKVSTGDNPYPFCNTFDKWANGQVRTTCDPQQQAVRTCNLVARSSAIDPQYTYFNQTMANAANSSIPTQYSGAIMFADYCPYYAEPALSYSSANKNYVFTTCSVALYNPPSSSNFALETYNSGSLCLRQATPTFLYQCSSYVQATRSGSGCYPVTCSSTSVTINVNGQVLTCTSELQTLSWTPMVAQLNVSQFSYMPTLVAGTIVCPQCDNACPNMYCPMQRVQANSTTLLNTDQTDYSTATMSILLDAPCSNVWPISTSTSTSTPTSTVISTSTSTSTVTFTSTSTSRSTSKSTSNSTTTSIATSTSSTSLSASTSNLKTTTNPTSTTKTTTKPTSTTKTTTKPTSTSKTTKPTSTSTKKRTTSLLASSTRVSNCPNCSSYANCVTTNSTFYCVCQTGYYGNGQTCTNINQQTNVVIQTNVSFPIMADLSDVLSPTSDNYLQVKQDLESSFEAALSNISGYHSGSAAVRKMYSGSLITHISAVFDSPAATRSSDGPSYLSAMNTMLANSASNRGQNCSIGPFTNVNCSQATINSSDQDPCADSQCPSDMQCIASSSFEYVCKCTLQNCNSASKATSLTRQFNLHQLLYLVLTSIAYQLCNIAL